MGRSRSSETTSRCNTRNAHHGRRHAGRRRLADDWLTLRRSDQPHRRRRRARLEAAHWRRYRTGPGLARRRLARATTDLTRDRPPAGVIPGYDHQGSETEPLTAGASLFLTAHRV